MFSPIASTQRAVVPETWPLSNPTDDHTLHLTQKVEMQAAQPSIFTDRSPHLAGLKPMRIISDLTKTITLLLKSKTLSKYERTGKTYLGK